MVGDTANLAARTESLTKQYGVSCIFTDRTYERVSAIDNHIIRNLDEVVVKGREGSVAIFELMLEELPHGDEFVAAMALYREGRFDQARQAFESYIGSSPDDPVARIYLDRCRQFVESRPENWSGISIMDEK